MFKSSFRPYPLLCSALRPGRSCLKSGHSRALFSLSDLTKFAPFASEEGNNGKPDDPHTYHERKIFPYKPSQLYSVVSDVNSYPRFLPFCVGARVLSRAAPQDPNAIGRAGTVNMQAEMTVGFMAIKERYVSDVTCIPYESVSAVASSSTPLFTHLSTVWRFQKASPRSPHPSSQPPSKTVEDSPPANEQNTSTDDGPTLVTLDLSFSFANPMHAAVSAAFFGQVSKMMVSAFEERCMDLYGPGDK